MYKSNLMINQQKYPSVLLENLIEEFSKLPGIGKRTALRFALHLLKNEIVVSEKLGNAILKFRTEINHCLICHNVCDSSICEICKNEERNREIICVVENVSDVVAVEKTLQFKGLYHVLGGVISPMNNTTPNDLEITSLIGRVSEGGIKEVILAISPDMDGDTTCLYIYKKLTGFNIEISTIARGVSVGDSLEYADEITLGRSIINRVRYTS
jgi:recombination protein RecR